MSDFYIYGSDDVSQLTTQETLNINKIDKPITIVPLVNMSYVNPKGNSLTCFLQYGEKNPYRKGSKSNGKDHWLYFPANLNTEKCYGKLLFPDSKPSMKFYLPIAIKVGSNWVHSFLTGGRLGYQALLAADSAMIGEAIKSRSGDKFYRGKGFKDVRLKITKSGKSPKLIFSVIPIGGQQATTTGVTARSTHEVLDFQSKEEIFQYLMEQEVPIELLDVFVKPKAPVVADQSHPIEFEEEIPENDVPF